MRTYGKLMHLMGQLLILSTLITAVFPTPTPPLPQIYFYFEAQGFNLVSLVHNCGYYTDHVWWRSFFFFFLILFNCALAEIRRVAKSLIPLFQPVDVINYPSIQTCSALTAACRRLRNADGPTNARLRQMNTNQSGPPPRWQPAGRSDTADWQELRSMYNHVSIIDVCNAGPHKIITRAIRSALGVLQNGGFR